MHNAPAVLYPVGRSQRLAAFLALTWGLGVAVCAGWSIEAGEFNGRHWTAVACLVACAGMVTAGWRAMPVGKLRFDGQTWWWATGFRSEVSVELRVRLDLQHGLLLFVRDAAGTVSWCYAERVLAPQRWNELRRAVYASAEALPPAADGAVF